MFTILPWFWGAQVIIGLPLLYADLKWKRVSFFFVVLFVGMLIGVAALQQEIATFIVKGFLAILCIIFIYRVFPRKMGIADLSLIAAIFIYLPPQKFPFFLIFCGIFGLITAFVWRVKFQERIFPFIPAILFSFWLQLFLEGRV